MAKANNYFVVDPSDKSDGNKKQLTVHFSERVDRKTDTLALATLENNFKLLVSLIKD